MKGLLTFTLAAGVAISTSSISQAAGVIKGGANATKAPATAQIPGNGGLTLAIDRMSLIREIDQLNAMLSASEPMGDESAQNQSVPTKLGAWSF